MRVLHLMRVEFISFATISQTHMQHDFMMNTWNDWMAYSHVYIKLRKTASQQIPKRN